MTVRGFGKADGRDRSLRTGDPVSARAAAVVIGGSSLALWAVIVAVIFFIVR